MATVTRWVIADDTDPSITYLGTGWTQASPGNIGVWGLPYLFSSHKTSVNGTVLVQFSGTYISVTGSSIIAGNNTVNPDPNFTCILDGVSFARIPPYPFPVNNWNLCIIDGLLDGLHQLRMDITVISPDQAFWLDSIIYIPSPINPSTDVAVVISSADPAVHLDLSWQPLGDDANVTTHTNALAQVDFIGMSISWYGVYAPGFPLAPGTATWSVDGGPATQFTIQGTPESVNATIHDQPFFTTTPVNYGHHVLSVVFLGSATTTPLYLTYLIINNGSYALSSTSPSPFPFPSPVHTSSKPSVGPIIGGVLGGLALLILVVALLYRRRRNRPAEVKSNYVQGGNYNNPPPPNVYQQNPTNSAMTGVQSLDMGRPVVEPMIWNTRVPPPAPGFVSQHVTPAIGRPGVEPRMWGTPTPGFYSQQGSPDIGIHSVEPSVWSGSTMPSPSTPGFTGQQVGHTDISRPSAEPSIWSGSSVPSPLRQGFVGQQLPQDDIGRSSVEPRMPSTGVSPPPTPGFTGRVPSPSTPTVVGQEEPDPWMKYQETFGKFEAKSRDSEVVPPHVPIVAPGNVNAVPLEETPDETTPRRQLDSGIRLHSDMPDLPPHYTVE